MHSANVNSITRLRINTDGTGVRSVIFMQDCPLRCFWCCNPETRTSSYKTLSGEELYSYIEQDIPYFLTSGGGITFSGGEPLLQSEFLSRFIQTYCSDFRVDIETSLYAPAEKVRSLIPLIDTWNVDFKVFDVRKHRKYTGVSNRLILENLQLLRSSVPPEKLILTYPIIPGYNDSDKNIANMIQIMDTLHLSQIELHPYRKEAEQKQLSEHFHVKRVPILSNEKYDRIQAAFRQHNIHPVEKQTLIGKEKCAYLKQLRRQFCETHHLDVAIPDCPVTEPCIGTCPQCEHELQQIRDLSNHKS